MIVKRVDYFHSKDIYLIEALSLIASDFLGQQKTLWFFKAFWLTIIIYLQVLLSTIKFKGIFIKPT